MNFQRQVFDLAKSRGINISRLTAGEYEKLAIEVRSLREKARDLYTREESKLSVGLLRKPVSLPVLEHRQTTCRKNSCGSYGVLADGSEVCHRCSCSGKNLTRKWMDPKQECPGEYWKKIE